MGINRGIQEKYDEQAIYEKVKGISGLFTNKTPFQLINGENKVCNPEEVIAEGEKYLKDLFFDHRQIGELPQTDDSPH